MLKIYVPADSKKALNARLTSGEVIWGECFSIVNPGLHALDAELPKGTVISIYSKVIGGSPYAKAYGTWDGTKVR